MRVPLWLGALLAGCGSGNLEGAWTGTCALDDPEAGTTLRMELSLDVGAEKGGEVEGTGEVRWKDHKWQGELEGERHGAEMDLWLELNRKHESLRLDMVGEQDGDDFVGECFSAYLSGQLELRRD